MRNIYVFFLGLIFSLPVMGQEIDDFKYVVVPDKFEFTKDADMYQVNSLTEFLFHKYGFDAFLKGEELPEEVLKDKCRALYSDVENNSGLFVTRLKVILKDCNDKIIFVSEEGTSRAKDYKTAYHEALRQAFESIGRLNYSYRPGSKISSEVNIETDTTQTVPEKKTVIVTAIPKVPVEEIPNLNQASQAAPDAEEMTFSKDGLIFGLKKSGKGYDLFQKGMAEPFASLIPSSDKKSFIYSSIKDQGIARFQENGDLLIEILDKESNSTQSRVYRRQN